MHVFFFCKKKMFSKKKKAKKKKDRQEWIYPSDRTRVYFGILGIQGFNGYGLVFGYYYVFYRKCNENQKQS